MLKEHGYKLKEEELTSADIRVARTDVSEIALAVVSPVPRIRVGTVPTPVLYPAPTVLYRTLGPGRPLRESTVSWQCCEV